MIPLGYPCGATAISVVKLTDRVAKFTKAPKTGRLELRDAILPGLELRITENDARSWAVLYRSNGRLRRLTLGRYPRLTLADARDAARAAFRAIAGGADPATEKRLARGGRGGLDVRSVGQLLDAYVERRLKPQTRSARWQGEVERLIRDYIKPAIGHYAAAELRPALVAELLDRFVDAGVPMRARNAHKVIRAAYRWAAGERGILTANPLAALRSPTRDVKRDRVLTDDELRALWSTWLVDASPYAAVCRVLLLTGQRVQEVGRMRWSELGADGAWTIPAARYKTGVPHLVTLPEAARAILAARARVEKSDFVFTHGGTALGAWSKFKADLDVAALAALRKAMAERGEDADQAKLPPWQLRDLRRTARTLLSRAGVAGEISERVLGHAQPGVAGIYDRHAYQSEKAAALEQLAALVGRIVNPRSNVSHLGEQRARKTAPGGSGGAAGEPIADRA